VESDLRFHRVPAPGEALPAFLQAIGGVQGIIEASSRSASRHAVDGSAYAGLESAGSILAERAAQGR